MQQLLALKEQLLSSKDDQINFQIFTINEKDKEIKKLQEEGKEKDLKILDLEERLQTQLAFRFGSHSQKNLLSSLYYLMILTIISLAVNAAVKRLLTILNVSQSITTFMKKKRYAAAEQGL